MEKFSIGILSWRSTDVLINTLTSYHNNGLLSYCKDVNIYFQEINDTDRQIAAHYGVKAIGTKENVGIGKGFLELAKNASNDKILLLEHDWCLVENLEITKQRLESGLSLLDVGYDCVRMRHRINFGRPHFSLKYKDKELDYFDPEIKMEHPHLLDSLHWCNPAEKFPSKIGNQDWKGESYFVSTSRYACFTNNPCLYKKDFYLKTVKPFMGEGIDLEGKISYWWARQNFNVAHGEGLFSHNDFKKYSSL